MRAWAEVYDTNGVKVAFIDALRSASASEYLDSAGTFTLECALDERVIDYLVDGNEVRLLVMEDEEAAQEWTRGRIIRRTIDERESALSIKVDGRNLLDELRDKVVGLGRSYEAQTVQTILTDLLGLLTGWTLDIEAGAAARLQTARYDGAKVLKAIVRTVEELGLHFRRGTTARSLEVGAFGDRLTTLSGDPVRAIKPPSSITAEIYNADDILLIDKFEVVEDDDETINWVIPLGAGEGAAATSLRDTSYEILNVDNTVYRNGNPPTYPIYRRVNGNGIVEHYVDASEGGRTRQETITFKEIGPISNSTIAKQLASDALAVASFAWLERHRTALKSYKISVQKMRVSLRPGQKIRLTYKGIAEMWGNPKATRPDLTYISVNEDVWVMGVQRNISEGGVSYTLEVCTVDRYGKTDQDLMVEVVEAMQIRNLALGTDTFWSENTYLDYVAYIRSHGQGRYANFKFQVDEQATDVFRVIIRFKTYPLIALNRVTGVVPAVGSNIDNVFDIVEGDQHPKGVELHVNGVDVTSEYGGPWNPDPTDNTALNVTCDITQLIIDAGILNEHTLQIRATVDGDGTPYQLLGYAGPGLLIGQRSSGLVEMNIRVRGAARAI